MLVNTILTFDIEDWQHVNYCSYKPPNQSPPSIVLEGTNRILELLALTEARATFFILGEIAEAHPTLIREISQAGHEVACHGWRHALIGSQSPCTWLTELRKAKSSLESILGSAVIGFRAPCWSITPESRWMLDLIAEAGFQYDSSLARIGTGLYGYRGCPAYPFILQLRKHVLIEIPFSVANYGLVSLPLGGGTYFRFYPYWLTALGIKRLQAVGRPTMLFSHPREFVLAQPILDLKFTERFVHYVNLVTTAAKFRRILEEFSGVGIAEYLQKCFEEEHDLETYYPESGAKSDVSFKRVPDARLRTLINYSIRQNPSQIEDRHKP